MGQAHDDTQTWEERYVSSMERVQSTFRRYGLLDSYVKFIPGFFNESLPGAPLGSLAVVHIDADSYDSVLDALKGLYPKLSEGGYLVIDDYHLAGVRTAVREYRTAQHIAEPLLPVPTDYVSTCRADPIGTAGGDFLYRKTKHLVTRVGSIGSAFWQKSMAI